MTTIDFKRIRTSKEFAIVEYLREISPDLPLFTVTEHVLGAIQCGALPPYVMSIVLSFAKLPEATRLAIDQDFSVQVRRIGIRHLGRLLGKGVSLDNFGGIEHLAYLFNSLSSYEVKQLSQSVARSSSMGALEELCETLVAALGPEARPLSEPYSSMLRVCSRTFTVNMVDKYPALDYTLPDLLDIDSSRQKVLDALYTGDALPECTEDLLHRLPHGPRSAFGLTPSMEFSMAILKRVCASIGSPVKVSEQFVFNILVLPLARRVIKRNSQSTKYGIMALIFSRVCNFLIKNPTAGRFVSFHDDYDLGKIAVKCWSRDTVKFEPYLQKLMQYSQAKSKKEFFDGYNRSFRDLPKRLRYRFLQLVASQTTPSATNIESIPSLRESEIQKWPVWVLQCIPRDRALSLLSRLMEARHDDFLTADPLLWESLAYQRIAPRNCDLDETLFLTFLERNRIGALNRVRGAVEDLKRKSSTTRERADRASYAQSAFFYAIASGSLELYHATITWSKRFLKDPLTVPILFSEKTLLIHESLDLLVGLPPMKSEDGILHPRANAEVLESTQSVIDRISFANKIMLTLFSFACSSLREPFFNQSHWKAVLDLPTNVAKRRVARIQTGDLEEYEQTVLDLTKDLLVDIESQALQPGNERLSYLTQQSVGRNYRDPLPSGTKGRPAVLTFFDNVAMARDHTWSLYRLREWPATASLPSSFPRGLPLAKLVGPFERTDRNIVDLLSGSRHFPYITKRAKALVFMSSSVALSTYLYNDEAKEAISSFIDSYPLALRIYVLGKEENDRDRAIKLAWRHAMGPLTGTRMTSQEAQEYWDSIFREALGDHAQDKMFKVAHDGEEPCLRLPLDENLHGQIEWDPTWMQHPRVEDKHIPVKTIDWCTYTSLSMWDNKLHVRVPPSPSGPPQIILKGYRPPRISSTIQMFDEKEAHIAAALLYLDTHLGSSQRVLSKPFPSQSNIRYPAMFLDESFFSRKEMTTGMALQIIKNMVNMVPPALLELLAKNSIEALRQVPADSTKLSDMELVAFELCKILTDSDRPHLAISMIVDIVSGLPQASSWHRKLLTTSFLRRLSRIQANDLVMTLTNRIFLQEGSFVKVGTVKFLAQLLQDANFVTPSFAVDVLGLVLQKSRHIDIRHAAVVSLLQILRNCKIKPLAENILKNLETLQNVAGSFNERYPMSEDDWQVAEAKQELPEPYSLNERAPILRELLNAPLSLGLTSAVSSQDFFMRIVLPVITHSCQSNARWMRLFCRKYGMDDFIESFPTSPVDPTVLNIMFAQHLSYLPAAWLSIIHERFKFGISPHPTVPTMKSKLEKDRKLKQGPEGHWLKQIQSMLDLLPIQLLQRSLSPTGITLQAVQKLVMEEAKLLLARPLQNDELWGRMSNGLAHTGGRSLERDTRWEQQAKPVLEKIVKHLSELKNVSCLYSLRLELLVVLHDEKQDSIEDFTRRLKDFLALHVVRNNELPYHKRFDDLRRVIATKLTSEGQIQVALRLGRLETSVPLKLKDYLCIDLADALVKNDRTQLGIDNPDVAGMIQSWNACDDEYINSLRQV